MYRFTRVVTTKTVHDLAPGVQFATEVIAYVNKTYSLKMKYGVEVFGGTKIHFTWDADSLDKIMEINAKVAQDREYLGMLGKNKHLWLEGSVKDTLVLYSE